MLAMASPQDGRRGLSQL